MHDAFAQFGALMKSWLDALEARLEARLEAKFDVRLSAQEARLMSKVAGEAMEARLMGELKRHTTASNEELLQRINTLHEPLRDLPARVTRLEAKVFAPAKRSSATARRRKRS